MGAVWTPRCGRYAWFCLLLDSSPSGPPADAVPAALSRPPAKPLQLFSRRAAQQLYSNQRLQRWCFDVELVYLAQRLKVGVWGWWAVLGPCRCFLGQRRSAVCPSVPACRARCARSYCAGPFLLFTSLQVPMAEVQVTWTEIPGSKIRITSMAHMALELAMIKAGYSGEGASQGRRVGRGGVAGTARLLVL